MNTERRDFNTEAATWDEKPARVKLAGDLFVAIRDKAPLSPASRMLDFGCGTGLLTLQLAPLVGSVTGVDTSSGMLEVMKAKIAAQGRKNVGCTLLVGDGEPALTGEYDLIVSTMTLHHVEHVAPLLKQFYLHLVPGGTLCIADLDLDGGQFHEDATGVFHSGFDRSWLRHAFEEAGFVDIGDSTAAEIVKPDAAGQPRSYSVFLMTGCRG